MRFTIPAILLSLFAAPAVRAEVKMNKETKEATANALKWLASKQNKDDGSWSDGRYFHNTAITSFALLAFMSQGHFPNQGLYGPEVNQGAKFLMAAQRDDGYIVGARGGNMYCHGMAALALGELWGTTGNDDIKPHLKKAVNLIVGSQSNQGGWRYEPNRSGADISVTIMQVMALRAAKNAGIHVPDETMKKAIKYIEACYRPQAGGFTYMPSSGAPGFARTAAGTCILFLAGDYNAKQIPQAVEFLQRHFNDRQHFYYGHYYAAHAMHQVGGKAWEDWYDKLVRHFVTSKSQHPDGYWTGSDGTGVGPVYQTAIATIILSVPMHYLPIFQR